MSASGGRRRGRQARSTPASTTWSWSTSPTATWSATPATSRPPSRPSRPWTPASAGSSMPPAGRAASPIVTADHGNCEQKIDPDHRRPAHRPHHLRCAADRGGRPLQGQEAPRRRPPGRHRPDLPGSDGPAQAGGDDRGLAVAQGVIQGRPSCCILLSCLVLASPGQVAGRRLRAAVNSPCLLLIFFHVVRPQRAGIHSAPR